MRIGMKKLTTIMAGIVCAAVMTTQAVVINFTGMDPNAGAVGVGTLAFGQTLTDNQVFSNLSYTVSGLTIDADGAANDEITVTMVLGGYDSGGSATLNWDIINASVQEIDILISVDTRTLRTQRLFRSRAAHNRRRRFGCQL
jgi:hypothetical protein